MLKKILIFVVITAFVGGLTAYYMWNKPHSDIGKPNFIVTATALATEFSADENAATEKYVGTMDKMIVVQVSGKIVDIGRDTSGISLSLETGDPLNGVSCVLDKFTEQRKTDYKIGEDVTLKGTCTGKLSDVVIDRCVLSY